MDLLNISNTSGISNTSDISASSSSMSFRIAASIIYILLCLAGIIGYFLYCYIVIKNWKALSNPFYAFTVSMAIPECVSNLITMFYAVPAMTSSRSGTGAAMAAPWLRDILGFTCDYTWFVVCSHMVLIASNRVTALKWSQNYSRHFSKHRLIALLVGSYAIAFIVPVITYRCGCRMEFAEFAWGVACDSAIACSSASALVDTIWTNTQIVFVLLCDAFILVHVYKKGKQMQPSRQQQQEQSSQQRHFKREKALILQFSAVAVILILGQCVFWILRTFNSDGNTASKIVGFVSMLLSVLTYSLNPFLYFFFSSEIRRRLFGAKGQGANTKIAPTTMSQNINNNARSAVQH